MDTDCDGRPCCYIYRPLGSAGTPATLNLGMFFLRTYIYFLLSSFKERLGGMSDSSSVTEFCKCGTYLMKV